MDPQNSNLYLKKPALHTQSPDPSTCCCLARDAGPIQAQHSEAPFYSPDSELGGYAPK